MREASVADSTPGVALTRDSTIIAVEGYMPRDGESLETTFAVVAPHYFRALRIPLRAERAFSPDDVAGRRSPSFNEAMARRFWPGAIRSAARSVEATASSPWWVSPPT